jgi:CBS domain-containing protein
LIACVKEFRAPAEPKKRRARIFCEGTVDACLTWGGTTMTTINDILDTKGHDIHTVRLEATVFAAVEEMCRLRVGALVAMGADGEPAGMLSERDIMGRVLLARRDPDTTRVVDVMTTELVCIAPEASVTEAMAIMTERRCRHLPVVVEGCVVGLVSIGDLTRSVSEQEEFTVRYLNDYISGRYPG